MKTLYIYLDAGIFFLDHFLQDLPTKQQERLLLQIAMLPLPPQLTKRPVKHFQM